MTGLAGESVGVLISRQGFEFHVSDVRRSFKLRLVVPLHLWRWRHGCDDTGQPFFWREIEYRPLFSKMSGSFGSLSPGTASLKLAGFIFAIMWRNQEEWCECQRRRFKKAGYEGHNL